MKTVVARDLVNGRGPADRLGGIAPEELVFMGYQIK